MRDAAQVACKGVAVVSQHCSHTAMHCAVDGSRFLWCAINGRALGGLSNAPGSRPWMFVAYVAIFAGIAGVREGSITALEVR